MVVDPHPFQEFCRLIERNVKDAVDGMTPTKRAEFNRRVEAGELPLDILADWEDAPHQIVTSRPAASP